MPLAGMAEMLLINTVCYIQLYVQALRDWGEVETKILSEVFELGMCSLKVCFHCSSATVVSPSTEK